MSRLLVMNHYYIKKGDNFSWIWFLCNTSIFIWSYGLYLKSFIFWQSTPQELTETHELRSITLDYRRECQHDDIVDSLTNPEPINEAGTISQLRGTNGTPASTKNEDGSLQFLHLLRLSTDGSEINRGRTEWSRKPQRQWWILFLFLFFVVCFTTH